MADMTLNSMMGDQGPVQPASRPNLDKGFNPLTMIIFFGILAAALLFVAYSVYVDVDATGTKVTTYLPYILLFIALLIALGFEFVNGFHDTANAVATVIYTHSLPAPIAVVWSGMFNLFGVLLSSGAVAFGIVSLLPVELILQVGSSAGFAMVFALLIAAIIWNVGTWYFGLPASSSHTLIGSIMGVGIMNAVLHGRSGTPGVDWTQATNIAKALLLSPLFGFALAATLLFILKTALVRATPALFKEPVNNQPPPLWIRSILVLTCSLVSFFHGSNDGQKGVGLIMLILIGVVPAYFALDESFSPTKLPGSLTKIEQVISSIDSSHLSLSDRHNLFEAKQINARLQQRFATLSDIHDIPKTERFQVRKDIMIMDRELTSLSKKEDVKLSEAEKKSLKDELKSVRKATDYSPTWVLLMISLSLGLGTMIGWKRIVKTVG